MSSDRATVSPEPINNFEAGGSRRARELATSMPAARTAVVRTARSRIAAAKSKNARAAPLGPTPERLAKGDIDVRIGAHRAIPPIERLRDQGKLAPKQLANGQMTFDPRENQALYEAAVKLKRHFDGCMRGVQAQDLNKIIGGGANDDLTKEEAWVHDYDMFRDACRIMGWREDQPRRGAGRIVVEVVCYEAPVADAARKHLGAGKLEPLMGAAMDRLREGLFALASQWKMC